MSSEPDAKPATEPTAATVAPQTSEPAAASAKPAALDTAAIATKDTGDASSRAPDAQADTSKPDAPKVVAVPAEGGSAETKKDGTDDAAKDPAAEAPPPPMVSMGDLFKYADGLDKVLLGVGLFAAFCNGAGMPAFSEVFGRILNELAKNPANLEKSIGEVALIMIYIGIIVFALSSIQVACLMIQAERQVSRIREKYFAALLNQDAAFHDEHKPGELTSRLLGDTKVIQDGINDKVALGLQNFSMFLFGYGFGFYRSWKLTLVMLSTLPLLAGVGIAFSMILNSATTKSREGFAKAQAIADEALQNIRVLQIFGQEQRIEESFNDALEPARAAGVKKEFTSMAGVGASYGIIFSSYSVAFWFASYLIEWRENTVGEVTAVFFAVLMGSFGIGLVFPTLGGLATARGAAHKVFEVIDRVPTIRLGAGGKTLASLNGRVDLKNVKFSYPTRLDQKLFTDLTLTIEAGSTVAFSGASGCGKSSVVALLQRMYDPLSGTVLIDGEDLKDLDLAWWRDQVGIVAQEPNLFGGSIAENVRVGKATATQEEIETACRQANVHDTIMTLPDKYETSVGSIGSQLSGGQKQRLAIARALIKDPKFIILDEATSALDRKSEAEVQAALDDLIASGGKRRTTVIIAHRLTTIRRADVIHYVTYDELEGSKIEESGTFDELMAKGGAFATMASKQSKSMSKIDSEDAPSPTSQAAASAAVVNVSFSAKPEDVLKKQVEEEEKAVEVKMGRLMELASGSSWSLPVGVLGSIISGGIYPAYSIVLSNMLDVFTRNTPQDVRKQTPLWASLFIAIGLGCFIGWSLQAFYSIAGERLTMRLRGRLFRAMVRQDMTFYDTPGRDAGALGGMLSGDCEAVHMLYGPAIGYKIQMFCNLSAGIIIAFVYSWKVALVTLAAAPIMILTGAIQQAMMVGFAQFGESMADTIVGESLTNIRTVMAFNMQGKQIAAFESTSAANRASSIRLGAISGVVFGVTQFSFYGVFALSFWYGGTLIAKGEIKFLDVLIAAMAILMGAMGAGEAGGWAAKVQGGETAAKHVFSIIDRKPRIDPEDVGDKELGDGCNIEFRDVQFTYPARPNAKVLRHFTGRMPNGSQTGLMGSTGCGKSTIVQMLARFYEPTHGELLVNGKALSAIDLKHWRSQMSVVMQEPSLFSGTIRDNICFGVPTATQEDIERVAKWAAVHDDVMQMTAGYDTDVGFKGKMLSGGQKQRVAIARALLRKPRLLLLDEATSALDNATEARVSEGIAQAQRETPMTTVSVAHRLTTIRHSDQIILLDNGVIVEQGSHDELVALDGEYKVRWEMYQASMQ